MIIPPQLTLQDPKSIDYDLKFRRIFNLRMLLIQRNFLAVEPRHQLNGTALHHKEAANKGWAPPNSQ
jgi:hypothetical protein